MTQAVRRALAAAAVVLGIASLALSGGCSKTSPVLALPNQRPVAEITQAPTSTTTPYWYAYEMRWSGHDPDGSIVRWEYAVDPPTAANAETTWTSTQENRTVVTFRATTVDSVGAPSAHDFHVFVLRAVDDRGGRSEPQSRAFNAYTVTPTVRILAPRPSHLLTTTVGSSFSIRITGTDPDGRTTQMPVKYRYKVFGEGGRDFDFLTLLVNPDSLRRYYAPAFATWDSVSSDTAVVLLQDLIPDRDYVVVAIAEDETGAYSPIFNFDMNMLYVHVDNRLLPGPRIRVFNPSFDFTTGGAYSTRPVVNTEVPANEPVQINWAATVSGGGFVTSYRWAVDIQDVTDDTPRSNEETDLAHWSAPSVFTTRGVVPPVPGVLPDQPIVKNFYVEATDNGGNKSLAVVQLMFVQPAFDRPLLFVDDTRFRTDRLAANGCTQPPAEAWPTSAELDTFLYARGGVPWRCYPAGTRSAPGIYAGYDFDTLGTRGSDVPIVSLRTLGHYRHVVWYVDRQSATYQGSDIRLNPITSLRYMSTPGRSNTLATWVRQGGHLWLYGGGAATAMQLPWELVQPNGGVFSSTDGELVPGRFMYDLCGWRSEITIGTMINALQAPPPENRTPGVNWALLPGDLQEKTYITDDVPPQRFDFDFYQSYCFGEWISKPNATSERDGVGREVAVLDTLYNGAGGTVQQRPVMTYFHGPQSGTVVFSGFPVWYLRREHAIAISDFVLQGVWNLPRRAVAR